MCKAEQHVGDPRSRVAAGLIMSPAPMPRVLVVEDVVQVRQLFGRFLATAGMEPSFAADGADGLAAARASPPDVVLCDMEMPRMNGVALCAALRADDATRRLPILIVTGGGGGSAQAALDAGCDVVLPKPCPRALLIATVRDLLASRRAAEAATTPQPSPAVRP
jgi:two-component system cell cycle response regulator